MISIEHLSSSTIFGENGSVTVSPHAMLGIGLYVYVNHTPHYILVGVYNVVMQFNPIIRWSSMKFVVCDFIEYLVSTYNGYGSKYRPIIDIYFQVKVPLVHYRNVITCISMYALLFEWYNNVIIYYTHPSCLLKRVKGRLSNKSFTFNRIDITPTCRGEIHGPLSSQWFIKELRLFNSTSHVDLTWTPLGKVKYNNTSPNSSKGLRPLLVQTKSVRRHASIRFCSPLFPVQTKKNKAHHSKNGKLLVNENSNSCNLINNSLPVHDCTCPDKYLAGCPKKHHVRCNLTGPIVRETKSDKVDSVPEGSPEIVKEELFTEIPLPNCKRSKKSNNTPLTVKKKGKNVGGESNFQSEITDIAVSKKGKNKKGSKIAPPLDPVDLKWKEYNDLFKTFKYKNKHKILVPGKFHVDLDQILESVPEDIVDRIKVMSTPLKDYDSPLFEGSVNDLGPIARLTFDKVNTILTNVNTLLRERKDRRDDPRIRDLIQEIGKCKKIKYDDSTSNIKDLRILLYRLLAGSPANYDTSRVCPLVDPELYSYLDWYRDPFIVSPSPDSLKEKVKFSLISSIGTYIKTDAEPLARAFAVSRKRKFMPPSKFHSIIRTMSEKYSYDADVVWKAFERFVPNKWSQKMTPEDYVSSLWSFNYIDPAYWAIELEANKTWDDVQVVLRGVVDSIKSSMKLYVISYCEYGSFDSIHKDLIKESMKESFKTYQRTPMVQYMYEVMQADGLHKRDILDFIYINYMREIRLASVRSHASSAHQVLDKIADMQMKYARQIKSDYHREDDSDYWLLPDYYEPFVTELSEKQMAEVEQIAKITRGRKFSKKNKSKEVFHFGFEESTSEKCFCDCELQSHEITNMIVDAGVSISKFALFNSLAICIVGTILYYLVNVQYIAGYIFRRQRDSFITSFLSKLSSYNLSPEVKLKLLTFTSTIQVIYYLLIGDYNSALISSSGLILSNHDAIVSSIAKLISGEYNFDFSVFGSLTSFHMSDYLSAFGITVQDSEVELQSFPFLSSKAYGVVMEFVSYFIPTEITAEDKRSIMLNLGLISSIHRVYKELSLTIKYVVSFVCRFVYGVDPYDDGLTRYSKDLATMCLEVRSLIDSDISVTDRVKVNRLLELKELIHEYLYKDDRAKLLFSHTLKLFSRALSDSTDLLTKLRISSYSGESRVEPVCVLFTGIPGTGKSSTMKSLTKACLLTYLKQQNPDDKLTFDQVEEAYKPAVFVKATGSEYYDGYCGQLFTHIDDLFTDQDPRKRIVESQDVIKMTNIAAYKLNMSDVPDKAATLFKSEYLFMSTNCWRESWTQNHSLGLTDTEAFRRRCHFVVNSNVKCTSGDMDMKFPRFRVEQVVSSRELSIKEVNYVDEKQYNKLVLDYKEGLYNTDYVSFETCKPDQLVGKYISEFELARLVINQRELHYRKLKDAHNKIQDYDVLAETLLTDIVEPQAYSSTWLDSAIQSCGVSSLQNKLPCSVKDLCNAYTYLNDLNMHDTGNSLFYQVFVRDPLEYVYGKTQNLCDFFTSNPFIAFGILAACVAIPAAYFLTRKDETLFEEQSDVTGHKHYDVYRHEVLPRNISKHHRNRRHQKMMSARKRGYDVQSHEIEAPMLRFSRSVLYANVIRYAKKDNSPVYMNNFNVIHLKDDLYVAPYHGFMKVVEDQLEPQSDYYDILEIRHNEDTITRHPFPIDLYSLGDIDMVLVKLRVNPTPTSCSSGIRDGTNYTEFSNVVVLSRSASGELRTIKGVVTASPYNVRYKTGSMVCELASPPAYFATTQKGDSGGLVLSVNIDGSYSIVGMHAGVKFTPDKTICFAIPITQDVLAIPDEESDIETQSLEFPLHVKRTMAPMYVPDRSVLKGTGVSSGSSSACPGHIVGFPPSKKPAHLRPFRHRDVIIDPNIVALSKLHQDRTICELLPRDELVSHLASHYPRPTDPEYTPRRLTWEESLNGIVKLEYMPISMKSAPGYPWSIGHCKKTDYIDVLNAVNNCQLLQMKPDFHKTIEEYENKLLEGGDIEVLWMDCLKDEKRPIEKVDQGKTRLFSICPLHYLLLFRRYFGMFVCYSHHFNVTAPMSCGINPHGREWGMLYARMNRYSGAVIAGDFSNYDGKLPADVGEIVLDFLTQWFDDEFNHVRRILFKHIYNATHVNRHGKQTYVYEVVDGNPSGNPFTTVYNSLCNIVMCYCVLKGDLGISPTRYELCVYGDDNVITISEDVNGVEHLRTATLTPHFKRRFDMSYTHWTKEDNIGKDTLLDIRYLGRKFVPAYEPTLVRAPLEPSIIMESLYWTRGVQESFSSTLTSALHELSHFPRDEFRHYCSLITNRLQAMQNAYHVGTYANYATIWKELVRRYSYDVLQERYSMEDEFSFCEVLPPYDADLIN